MRTPRSAGLSRRKTEYIKEQNKSQYGKYRAITNKKIPQQTLRDKDCRLQVSGQVSRTIVRPFRVAMPRLFT
jgi:hypothetical protein